MSIWLPRLALERWQRLAAPEPDARVALLSEGGHGPVVVAATEAALAVGVRAGMRLTDARALDPGLSAVTADPAGDAALLARLARWASRWSPLVEVDGEDGLRLDASGVAHLFGGERGLVADVEERFAALGLSARAAVAATAGAAWALARYASPSPLCGGGRDPSRSGGRERGGDSPSPRSPSASRPLPQRGEGLERDLAVLLAPLPVAALRLPAGVTRTLERLGLKTIGALAGIERRSLARRFREADNPLDALDRALGRRDEPLTAAPFEAVPRALLRLAEPVVHPEAGAQALDLLVPRLVAELETRKLGARRLVLAGYRVDGEVAAAAAGCALATREAKHLRRLLADKAGTLDPGFGFDAFTLEASWCEPLGAVQDGLIGGPPPALEVARLVDRLSVKLGPERVRRPVAHESHVPERASGWSSSPSELGEGNRSAKLRGGGVERSSKHPSTIPSARDGPPPHENVGRNALRPARLFDSPEAIGVIYATPEGLPRRFVWRRGVHDVVKAEGPERIAPEWWRERATARLRDYYRVEDREGRRFWIFREGVHGDGRGGEPAWYLHGVFG